MSGHTHSHIPHPVTPQGVVEDLTGRGMSDLRAGLIRTPLPANDTFLDGGWGGWGLCVGGPGEDRGLMRPAPWFRERGGHVRGWQACVGLVKQGVFG